MKVVKRTFLLVVALFGLFFAVSAQKNGGRTEFEEQVRQQRAEFERYKQALQADFKNYRDSLNTAFAKFLEESWKEFDLQRRELTFEPMPEPPVYVPV